jgi:hypothetical protein
MKGLPFTVGGLGVDKTFYGAARRIFGSWRNAIRAAGIAPQRVLTWERWTPAKILLMIRHLARRDRPMSAQQMEKRYHNLVTSARRHFGSWAKAVLAAGVKPTKLQRVVPWNQQRVIEAVLTRVLRGDSLVARDIEPRSLVEASHRLYGSWSAALKAAGLDPVFPASAPKRDIGPSSNNKLAIKSVRTEAVRQLWTKDRVVSGLLARLREQKPMDCTSMVRDDASLYHAARRHFRSWSEAMLAAGLNPDGHRRRRQGRLGPADANRREPRGDESDRDSDALNI